MQKTRSYLPTYQYHSPDNIYQPVPSTSSKPVDNRLPTQEGKQTSQAVPAKGQDLTIRHHGTGDKNADCQRGS